MGSCQQAGKYPCLGFGCQGVRLSPPATVRGMRATVVELARTVRADLRPEVDQLIRYGLEWVDGFGVEVHVRVARPRVAWVLVVPAARRHRGCRLTRTGGHDWL